MNEIDNNAAEEARARDAAALAGVTVPVTEGIEFEGVPDWLRRSLTPEQREAAWEAYCQEHGIERTMHAHARDIESRAKISLPVEAEAHPDLRALGKKEKDAARIAKMKRGIEQKKAKATGETRAMPLSGRDALAKIRGHDDTEK